MREQVDQTIPKRIISPAIWQREREGVVHAIHRPEQSSQRRGDLRKRSTGQYFPSARRLELLR